jgi:histidinol phosphatase-like enzyme (inositol monophosphatase family)
VTRRSKPSAQQLVQAAHSFADLAGRAILPHFRRRMSVDNKLGPAGFDPVTAADRAAERVMRKAIAETFPDHGIVGEEYPERRGAGRYTWVLDPIDGTRAFITGNPLWGTLIGLLEEGEPILGVMDQPFTCERFWGDGRKSSARDATGKVRKLKTRACARLADASLGTTHPDLFASRADAAAFSRLTKAARLTRYGGDCYGYCLVAAGHVDLVVEVGLKPHDIAALIPIIEGAGGLVTTWDGGPATRGGRIIAAGDARVHAEAMAVLGSS